MVEAMISLGDFYSDKLEDKNCVFWGTSRGYRYLVFPLPPRPPAETYRYMITSRHNFTGRFMSEWEGLGIEREREGGDKLVKGMNMNTIIMGIICTEAVIVAFKRNFRHLPAFHPCVLGTVVGSRT